MRQSTWSRRLWVRRRSLFALAAGAVTAVLLPSSLDLVTRALAGWCVTCTGFVGHAWWVMLHATADHIRERAREQDEGAGTVLALTVLAAMAGLVAIMLELAGQHAGGGSISGARIALVGWTILGSWALIHTAFAIHYAHEYHINTIERRPSPHQPLVFPGDSQPLYRDFLYFSFVIGVASQTADVAVGTPSLRWVVMWHGIVAFFFNATLIALGVNIASSTLIR